MKWYANLKIRAKLGVGFGMVIVFIIGLIAVMFSITLMATGNFDYLEGYPRTRRMVLNDITIHFRTSQHYLSEMSVPDPYDEGKIDRLSQGITTEISQISVLVQQYQESINADPRYSAQELAARMSDIGLIWQYVQTWQTQVVAPVTAAHREGRHSDVSEITAQTAAIPARVVTSLRDLKDLTTEYINLSATETTAFAFQLIYILMGLAAGAITFTVILMVIMIRALSHPIKRLAADVNEMAEGRLNVNIGSGMQTKDEVGDLSKSISRMAGTIIGLSDDLRSVSNSFHAEGDIEAKIDEGKYLGAYREVVASINELNASTVNDLLMFNKSLGEFNQGEFDAKIPTFPGKKRVFNETLDDFRTTMKSLTADIGGLAVAAADGRLDVRVSTEKYNGGWRELTNSLNNLVQAIVTPIHEMDRGLEALAQGNFNVRMEGGFKGEFKHMIDVFNEMAVNIGSYIAEISGVLSTLAGDDLDQEIKREYVGQFADIKNALNRIISRFNNVIADILSASEEVTLVAQQVSENSMSIAEGASDQAASVQALSDAILAINESTSLNAENAKNAKQLSDTSSAHAARGDTDIREMMTAMDGISESSGKISNIIKVIDGIAFQTNLLALNAAVEAARAGEHGKGFSVVAEEVRSLAGNSQSAASETSGLIDESMSRVKDGTQIAATTAATLRAIVEDVNKVAQIISDIATASEDQASSVAQVSEGIQRITNVVTNNSATSEMSASASQELAGQAEALRNLVSVFKLKK